MIEYLPLAGASIISVLILSCIAALIVAKNPLGAFKVWITWINKYWQYGLVIVAGLFAVLVSTSFKQEIKDKVQDDTKLNKDADKIKEKLNEVNSKAKIDIAIAKEKDETKKKELEDIKKIADPMERRKKLAELLSILLILSGTVVLGCAGKTMIDYISALPPPIDVKEYVQASQTAPEYSVLVQDGCSFEKLVLPAGVLVTVSNERIQVPGGILISDCKASQLIQYQSSAQRFYVERNQLALVYQSLNQACYQVESMYKKRLEEEINPNLWEQVDFEAGFLAGAGMCIGIDYAIRENQEH